MQKNQLVWKLVLCSLQKKMPVTLLYVLESKGSSPGRQGFSMAVNEAGEMAGSIGGGIMEHKFVELAKELMKSGGKGLLRKQIHDKAAGADQSGMICSGEQTILLYPVKSTDISAIEQLITSMEQCRNGTLLISSKGLYFSAVVPPEDYSFTMQSEEDWEYRERTGYKNQLYIIGGGHCALAFSRLMREMDFYITLYEEREGLNTVAQNQFAHEIMLLDDYTGLGNLIPSGKNQFVVIMTFGYRTDDIALRSLLGKQFAYLGVLGSRKKMEKLFAGYKNDGIGGDWLQRIHSPIGLDISSRSPEEIAVSIAAEIIQTKNRLKPE